MQYQNFMDMLVCTRMWSITDCSYIIIAVNSKHNHAHGLRARFVHVVFVLSISVQYVECNLTVNIYVVFSGPISVISLGTPGTKRLQVESYASLHKLISWKLHLLRTMACQVRLSPIPYTSKGSLVTRDYRNKIIKVF